MTINTKHYVGKKVKIKTIDIDGFITAIIIRDNNNIEYEVSYFIGDTYRINNFSEYQFEG